MASRDCPHGGCVQYVNENVAACMFDSEGQDFAIVLDEEDEPDMVKHYHKTRSGYLCTHRHYTQRGAERCHWTPAAEILLESLGLNV